MFKFVLCALFAVAVADPQWLINPSYSELLAPATTTITRSASSVVSDPYLVHPFGIGHLIKKRSAPLLETLTFDGGWSPYSYLNSHLTHSPINFAHLIKKRSPGLISPFNYVAPVPLATAYSSTLLHDLPLVSSYVTPAHFIKKRSAGWIAPASFVAPSPVASTYVASAPLAATAVLPSSPFWSGYSGIVPLIKK